MKDCPVLLVEDDENDILFVRHAFKQAQIVNPLQVVQTGDEAIDYLTGTGAFADRTQFPLPGLMLVDVNAARRRSGLDVLRCVRADAALRHIVVILWTSSAGPQAISEAYQCGANSFLLKPDNIDELAELVGLIKTYWLERNQPPPKHRSQG